MKSNQTSSAELIVPLPIEDEWLALELNPAHTSSYLRVVAADGTELSYQPIRLDSPEAWTALKQTLALGSAVSPYLEPERDQHHRALIRSHIAGVSAYDFESGICVLENGTEVSIEDCEVLRLELAKRLGVQAPPVPSRSQRSVDLAVQLLRSAAGALSMSCALPQARLSRRLMGLEGRLVTVHFADGTSASGVVERTPDFPPQHTLRGTSQNQRVDPAARILAVDLTTGNDCTTGEISW